MKYIDGRTKPSEAPLSPWACKHCDVRSESLGEAFAHIKDVHGINPLASVNDDRIQRQGAA